MPGQPRWFTYSSNESGGQFHVYVRPFNSGTPGRQYQVSTEAGGSQPRWWPDGKELFYISNGNLMAVEVHAGSALEFGTPKRLFSTGLDHPGSASGMRYAVSPDGKRFLINTGVGTNETNTAPIQIVLNWTAAPKR